jgi:hypothetical protein
MGTQHNQPITLVPAKAKATVMTDPLWNQNVQVPLRPAQPLQAPAPPAPMPYAFAQWRRDRNGNWY